MPETSYILAVCAIVFVVTLGLRALPFAALNKLRDAPLVQVLALWMPAGILGILNERRDRHQPPPSQMRERAERPRHWQHFFWLHPKFADLPRDIHL